MGLRILSHSGTIVAVQECDWEASCLRPACVGNDLAGRRGWVLLPSADADLDVDSAESADSVVSVVTRLQARRASRRRVPARSVTSGIDCNKIGPPQEECKACLDDVMETECSEACPAAGKGFYESVRFVFE